MAAPKPLSSVAFGSHFIPFSGESLRAFVNVSSHHLYFTVISIASHIFLLLRLSDVVFPFSFQGKFFVSTLFYSELENRARQGCLGDWVFFREGVYVFFMMWYTAGEGEHWVRTYQRQAMFTAWYQDENDMKVSERLLSFCQYLQLLLSLPGPSRYSRCCWILWFAYLVIKKYKLKQLTPKHTTTTVCSAVRLFINQPWEIHLSG